MLIWFLTIIIWGTGNAKINDADEIDSRWILKHALRQLGSDKYSSYELSSDTVGLLLADESVKALNLDQLVEVFVSHQSINLYVIGHASRHPSLKSIIRLNPHFDSNDFEYVINHNPSVELRVFASICYGGELLKADQLIKSKGKVCGVFGAFQHQYASGCRLISSKTEMSLLDWLGENMSTLLYDSLLINSPDYFHFTSDRLLLDPACWKLSSQGPITSLEHLNQIYTQSKHLSEQYLGLVRPDLSQLELNQDTNNKALWFRSQLYFNRKEIRKVLNPECRKLYDELRRCEKNGFKRN